MARPEPGTPRCLIERMVGASVTQDHLAAKVVFERCDPLIVQLAVTLEVWLTEGDLERRTRQLIRQLQDLGHIVTLEPAA